MDSTLRLEGPGAPSRLNQIVAGIARIFQEALNCDSDEALGRLCLEVAEEVTDSRCGFIGEVNPRTHRLDGIAVTDAAWSTEVLCAEVPLDGKSPAAMPIHRLLGQVLVQGKSLISNGPLLSNARRAGMPSEHISLRVFLGVPLLEGGQAIGMIGLANREGGYGDDERLAAEMLAPAVAEALQRRRANAALRASEQRYRTLFEAIDEGFAVIEILFDNAGKALDYRFLEINPAFARHTDLVDVVGRTARELVPDLEPDWMEIYGDVVQTRAPRRFVQEARAMGRWFEVEAFPVGEPEENKLGVLFTDITERRRVDAALREGAEAVRAAAMRDAYRVRLADALREITDPVEIQAEASRVLGEELGVGRVVYAELQADGVTLTIGPHYVNQMSAIGTSYRLDAFDSRLLSEFRAGRMLVHRNVGADAFLTDEHKAAFGELGIAAWIGVPLIKGGRFVAVLSVHHPTPRDWTTDEVRLVEETADRTWSAVARAASEARLRDADRRKDEFLATLAHELRNPLAPIKNGLQIARLMLEPDAPLRQTVDMMDRQLSHLTRLVNDLLDVGRITSGKIELQRERVALCDLIATTIETARPQIAARQHELLIDLGREALVVDGDADRLAQVFSNLLGNAAKYTHRGGRISVAVKREDDEAVVDVADSGIGIAACDLDHVFDLFSQVRMNQAHGEDGLGIGLTLVRQLVELHGGAVTAQSRGPGMGSTFTVRLPIATVVTPSAGDIVHKAAVTPAGPSLRILVVDDNADAAHSLAGLLELLGHEVHVTLDGMSAIDKAKGLHPDLVFLDLGMPVLDGIETARRLRALPDGHSMMLVALTGWGQDQYRERTHQAGFNGHLVKPADLARLTMVLQQVHRDDS